MPSFSVLFQTPAAIRAIEHPGSRSFSIFHPTVVAYLQIGIILHLLIIIFSFFNPLLDPMGRRGRRDPAAPAPDGQDESTTRRYRWRGWRHAAAIAVVVPIITRERRASPVGGRRRDRLSAREPEEGAAWTRARGRESAAG